MFLIAAQIDRSGGLLADDRWNSIVHSVQQRSRLPGLALSTSHWRILIVPTREFDRQQMLRWPIPLIYSSFCLTLGNRCTLELGAGAMLASWFRCGFDQTVIASDDNQTFLYRGVTATDRLCYSVDARGVYLASSEQPLAATIEPALDQLDQDYIACYLAALPPPQEATIFNCVRQVSVGRRLLFSRRSVHQLAPILPNPCERTTIRGDEMVVRSLRDTIEESVAGSILRGNHAGISLSGGLDSSTLAVALVRVTDPRGPRPLACSYGFPSFPGSDELERARRLAEHLGMGFACFDAEPYLPLSNADDSGCPDRPEASPYRAIRRAQLNLLQSLGVDLCLDGSFGDDAFDFDDSQIIADLVADGRLELVSGYFQRTWRENVRFILRQLRGLPRRMRSRRIPNRLHWLSAQWRTRSLEIWRAQLEDWKDFPSPGRALACFGPLAAISGANDACQNAETGVDFAFPFFNAEILRLLLSVRSYYSFRCRQWKWLLRESQRGLLPEWCRTHPKSADLTPVFRAAVDACPERWLDLGRKTSEQLHAFLPRGAAESARTGSTSELLDLWLRVQFQRWQTGIPRKLQE